MIDKFKYLMFNIKFKLLINKIPDLDLLQTAFTKTVYNNKYRYENISYKKLKKNLPLKSFKPCDIMNSIQVYYVTYDIKEYNKFINNESNVNARGLFKEYNNLKNKRFEFYKNNRTVLLLIYDMIKSNLFLEKDLEFSKLCNHLFNRMTNNVQSDNSELEERLAVELELISRINNRGW